MTNFSIAALQLALPYADNRDRIEREISAAMARFPWIQMVVVGELASFGPAVIHAEALPGITEQRYQALARRHSIWLVPGSLYEKHGDEVYNTASVIDPEGKVVGRYQKMYPFLPYEKGVAHGRHSLVFDVPDVGCFGVSICYDGWFAETTRELVCRGAEVILHPTMTGTADRDLELVLARANAIMNQCYFIDVNTAGAIGNGRSILVGPEGDVLHEAGEQTEIIPITIDLDRLREVRRNGTKRLGQVLKSFRDTDVEFPSYGEVRATIPSLAALGPLTLPKKSE